MFKNYIKISFRSFSKNKVYSFTNTIGLSLGIAVCLLVALFVRYERNFDGFHHKNIVRLYEVQKKDGFTSPKKVAQTMFPMASTMKAEFPEIKDFAQVVSWEKVPLNTESGNTSTGTLYETGESFLKVFNFKLLSGDPASALKNPNSIVLTEGTAHKLFGDQNAMGKIVRRYGRDTVNYLVTGILENVPDQSHLQFDALFSINTAESSAWLKDWNASWVFTYLDLQEGSDIKALTNKFPSYLKKYLPADQAASYSLVLQPMNEVHLNSADIGSDFLNGKKFNNSYLKILIAIALFTLVIAMINYINLTTAKSVKRVKEVSVRKVSGAMRFHITLQFMIEALLLSLFALCIALILIGLSLPMINSLTGRNMEFNLFEDPFGLIMALTITVLTGLVAGAFPAVLLASIEPITVLKGQLWVNSRSMLRNALVVVQFTVAIGLSMATITAFKQLNYIQNYDVGFNKNDVAVLHVSYAPRNRVENLMEQIRNTPGVADVTGSLRRLGNSIDLNKIIAETGNGSRELTSATMFVDFNYLSFYNIPLIAGRNLSASYGEDKAGNSYLINETMARELIAGSSDPKAPLSTLIGKGLHYSFQDSTGKIIGITRDFNFNSLHQKVEPLAITYQYEYYFTELSVKLQAKNSQQTLSAVRQKWNNNLPDQQFEYHFLEDHLQELYKSDQQTSTFIAVFTIVGLLISCIGLISLAAYNIQTRTKEIGLRKVLGSSISSIVALLSKEFIRLVILSILIATPITWWAIHKWLDGFAYQIKVSPWIFFLTGLSALLLALVTITYQAAKAAIANPVKSLRAE